MPGDVDEQALAAAEVVTDGAERKALASSWARCRVVDPFVGRPFGAAFGE